MATDEKPSKTQEVLVEIAQVGGAVTPLIPIALDLALKIKGLFAAAGDDIQLNIKTHGDQAIEDETAALEMANTWLKSKGLEPVSGVNG